MGRFDVDSTRFAQHTGPRAQREAPDSNQPALLVALEEQLGLKLESQRTAVPVLVIDSVEPLIEN
jgi:uncharacterized protein (TIGR03435 family)